MCARYSIALSAGALQEHFGLDDALDFAPMLNVAPTEIVPSVIAIHGGKRALAPMKWGFAPHWAKARGPLINTRSETVFEKSAFKKAIRERRCLLPASGFYEWKEEEGKKQPYYIYRADSAPIGFAGIFEPAADAASATFAILTKPSGGEVAALHDRVPVIVDERDYEHWLAGDADARTILGVVAGSLEADRLRFHRVTRKMSKAGYREHDSIEPLMTENSNQGGLFA